MALKNHKNKIPHSREGERIGVHMDRVYEEFGSGSCVRLHSNDWCVGTRSMVVTWLVEYRETFISIFIQIISLPSHF